MRVTRSPFARHRRSNRAAALGLAAVALLGTGCTTTEPAGKPRFACYDARGRVETTITTKGECEARDWEWRERL